MPICSPAPRACAFRLAPDRGIASPRRFGVTGWIGDNKGSAGAFHATPSFQIKGVRGVAHYPEMRLRCTRHILGSLALLAAVWAAPALARTSTGVQRVALERQFTGAPAHIAIDGMATAGCTPQVEGVTVDGADISVVLNAAATGCKSGRTVPYHLKADPGANAPPLVAGVYRVRVYSGAGSAPRLTAFALVDGSTSASAPAPESGFWWTQSDGLNASAAGTGMNLEVQGGQLAASLLGFTDAGSSTWYFGSATLSGRTARIRLVQLANGESWFSAIGTQPDVLNGPRLEIEFDSPSRAHAWLVRTDGNDDVQVREITFSRTAFEKGPAGTAWVGRWVLVPEDGAATRLFDFGSPSYRGAESFRLVDSTSDASLDCRLATGSQQADACTLTSSMSTIADFDQVGLDHFAGHGANGSPVQLVRVPR